jgi:hypothetical protein
VIDNYADCRRVLLAWREDAPAGEIPSAIDFVLQEVGKCEIRIMKWAEAYGRIETQLRLCQAGLLAPAVAMTNNPLTRDRQD